MIYSAWLFGLSLLFIALERLWPRTNQRMFRRGVWTDMVYLVFNGEYLGVLAGAAAVHLIACLDRALDLAHAREVFYLDFMADQPLWLQVLTLLLVFDFLQWAIHNLLHRVPALWEVHKVHHSIEEMDWIGNWRFHWGEVVVYRTLLYPFAAFFGFSVPAMFWFAVINTCVGHFAHANLRWNIGLAKYVFNSPQMHVWHHTHPDAGPADRNFGIILSLWDWLFGTAYLPEGRHPARLGFTGVESYPRTIIGQAVAPFVAIARAWPFQTPPSMRTMKSHRA